MSATGHFEWPPRRRQNQPNGAGNGRPSGYGGRPAAPHGELDQEAFLTAVQEIRWHLGDRIDPAAGRDEARSLIEAEVAAWIQERASDTSLPPPAQGIADRLSDAVYHELYGLGPLQPLIEDPSVEDVDVNGCDEVWVTYADGHKARGPIIAASDAELAEKIRYWSRLGNTPREFSMANPLLNVAMGTHDRIRLSAAMGVTPRPHVSIRRHRLVDVDLDGLVRLGTLDRPLKEFLAAAVRARKNIVVTGGTKAGKTTLLRALISVIDSDERIATLESDYELYLHHLERHRDVIPFEARQANSEGAGAITLRDLIPQALRHNPARIIVGEVRSDEIIPMLEAMNSGHEGSLCTIHANRGEEVFNRILLLADRGDLVMNPQSIHLFVGMALDLVVHIHRDRGTNQRYVSEVLEVLQPAETDRPTINHIFREGPDGRSVVAATPHFLDDLLAAGLDPNLLDGGAGLWQRGRWPMGGPG